MYDRKYEEYAADFILIAKRTLTEEEYRLFKFHYLLGADWKLCRARLKMDRGRFFHGVYRIQQKLGRAFRETEPYGIFPVYAYFEEERREARPLAEITQDDGKGARREAPRIVSRGKPGETRPAGSGKHPSARGRQVA